MIATLLGSVLLVAAVSGCCQVDKDQTANEMKGKLESAIPVGTSANAAEARLRERGFEVVRMTDASFVEGQHVREHADFIYGDRMDGCIVKRRWQVAAVLNGDSVSEIVVSTGLEGP